MTLDISNSTTSEQFLLEWYKQRCADDQLANKAIDYRTNIIIPYYQHASTGKWFCRDSVVIDWWCFKQPLMVLWYGHGATCTHTRMVSPCFQSSVYSLTSVTNRKHCVTEYFLYYVMDHINSVCMFVLFSSPYYCPLFNTYNYWKRAQAGTVVAGGGPYRVLRPLVDASESANQCNLGIGNERGVTLVYGWPYFWSCSGRWLSHSVYIHVVSEIIYYE